MPRQQLLPCKRQRSSTRHQRVDEGYPVGYVNPHITIWMVFSSEERLSSRAEIRQ